MLSVIEIAISGETFLFLNNLSTQQLEQVKSLAGAFRKQIKSSMNLEPKLILSEFCTEAEHKFQIILQPVFIASVVTLK